MSMINNIQNEIIEEFALLDGDMEMSNIYLMELGQKLPLLEEIYLCMRHLKKQRA